MGKSPKEKRNIMVISVCMLAAAIAFAVLSDERRAQFRYGPGAVFLYSFRKLSASESRGSLRWTYPVSSICSAVRLCFSVGR